MPHTSSVYIQSVFRALSCTRAQRVLLSTARVVRGKVVCRAVFLLSGGSLVVSQKVGQSILPRLVLPMPDN